MDASRLVVLVDDLPVRVDGVRVEHPARCKRGEHGEGDGLVLERVLDLVTQLHDRVDLDRWRAGTNKDEREGERRPRLGEVSVLCKAVTSQKDTHGTVLRTVQRG